MRMNLLRKNFNGGVKGTLAGLFAVSIIFGLSSRVGTEQSFIQHCLAVVSDHYYLLYFMIPLFLLLCFFVIADDSEIVILRYNTYFRYFCYKWLSLVVISIAFMLVQLLAIAISAMGLSINSNWAIVNGSTTQELFSVFSVYFSSPSLCFVAATGYMFVGLCVISLFTMWIGHFLSKSWTVKIMMILYMLSVGSIKTGLIMELPITMLNHIIILHHNLSSPSRFMITVATSAMLVCIIIWTMKKYWNRQLSLNKRQARGITAYYCKELISKKNIIILAVIVVVMVAWKYLQSAGNASGEEWIISIFAGHGIRSFHVLSLIEMLLLNCTPLYLFAVFLEKVSTEHSTFITIRLKKRKDILVGILVSALWLVLLYSIFLAVVPIIGLMVLGLLIDSNVLALISLSVGLKILDIAVQLLFITVLYCLFGKVTIGFIVVFTVNMLCIVPFYLAKYLPFGVSSLSRINLPQIGTEGITSSYAFGILVVTSGLLIFWLFFVGYKRLPKN